MESTNTKTLLRYLTQYHQSFEDHLSCLTRSFILLENRWRLFKAVSQGDYADQFRSGWERTEKNFEDYIEKAEAMRKFLGDRIEDLNKLNQGEEGIKTVSSHRYGVAPLQKSGGSPNIAGDVPDRDTLQSLFNTWLFFVNAIDLGFPVKLALDLASVPSDSYIIRNSITSVNKLKGAALFENPEAALRQLSNIWITTALGDQGEMSTLKALIESGITPDDIFTKPHLTNRDGEEACPDFYCPSQNIIAEAKAWKEIHSISNLKKVVKKYVACFKEHEKGELRLFFPKDICEENGKTLKELADNSKTEYVKVTICPMPETYKEVGWRREFFYRYIQHLVRATSS
ncbi:MAG: hypothetical protein HLUCCO16_20175 [Phormidium sp. OSCR]|nr:MAG: hypothetical protein HLUCCO16_20175 [Phormidium sp. OSCR]